jgi:hypothetical protein
MKVINYHRKIIQILERLHKAHPTYNVGKHLSTALDGSDMWGITDKEIFTSLQKYEIELNMDVNHEEDIEDIIKDGMNLGRILLEEEED